MMLSHLLRLYVYMYRASHLDNEYVRIDSTPHHMFIIVQYNENELLFGREEKIS